jgi:hypothetical protein
MRWDEDNSDSLDALLWLCGGSGCMYVMLPQYRGEYRCIREIRHEMKGGILYVARSECGAQQKKQSESPHHHHQLYWLLHGRTDGGLDFIRLSLPFTTAVQFTFYLLVSSKYTISHCLNVDASSDDNNMRLDDDDDARDLKSIFRIHISECFFSVRIFLCIWIRNLGITGNEESNSGFNHPVFCWMKDVTD